MNTNIFGEQVATKPCARIQLCWAYYFLNRISNAEAMTRAAYASLKSSYGENDEVTMSAQAALRVVLLRADDFDGAVEVETNLLKIHK